MVPPAFRRVLTAGFGAVAIFLGACSDAETPSFDNFQAIFDGHSFKNWDGDTSYWRIQDSSIVGTVTREHPLSANTFLIYTGSLPEDFELQLDYLVSADGNSGVQYRSEPVPGIPYALQGYQADLDGENVYTGQNYEERGRGFLAMRGQSVELRTAQTPLIIDTLASSDSLKALIHTNDWNALTIRADQFRMQHFINGVKMSEALDQDSINRKKTGLLGLQLHVAPQMQVKFRNIKIKSIRH